MATYVAYVMERMLYNFYKFLGDADEHNTQAVSDWWNLHSLGTISALGSAANLA